jgi:putative (di)nucleoside polyphosphate hydrolase
MMNETLDASKNYRPNVAAIVVSPAYPHKCQIFVAERIDIPEAWQFPQGGIDDGETPKEALLRELKEEIGTDNVDILAEYPSWISYDFPSNVAEKMKPFHGQKQRYFLVRIKNSTEINLATEHPEFSKFIYVDVEDTLKIVSHFKRNIYKKVIDYFKKTGYL